MEVLGGSKGNIHTLVPTPALPPQAWSAHCCEATEVGGSQSLRPQSRTEGSWSPGHAGPFAPGLADSFWTCRAPPQSCHNGAQFCGGLRPTGPCRPKLGLSELPLLPRPPGQRLGLRNAIPAEEAAAAAVEWAPPRNPSLIAHGPCHPHQLSHRRWGRGPAWAGS